MHSKSLRPTERTGYVDIDFSEIWRKKKIIGVIYMSLPDCVEYEKLERSGYFDAKNKPMFYCDECKDAIELGEEYYEIKRTKYCRFCGDEYVKEHFIKEAR